MTTAWYGCRPDTPDHNDHLFALRAVRAAPLPDVVDLRPWCPPVMNQGAIGSCTAHGVTGAVRSYIIRRATTYDFAMSRLQLYYDSRALEGTTASDAGAEIRNVIKTLAKKGVGHEELWPYDVTRFAAPPPPEIYDDAIQYEALSYERVGASALEIKQALAAGHPVIIGLSLYESFESDAVAATGFVPMPLPGERLVGGHCMYAVGAGQKPGTITLRNSWDTDWGDLGDCYIPEAYFDSGRYVSDCWIVPLFGSQPEGEAHVAP